MGTLVLVLTHFAFILTLEFNNNSVPGAQFWQARGVRAGWLAVSQVPLLVLLIMKNNPISFLVGVSYERLNVLHRWTGRMMLFLAILHFGYQSYGWQRFGLMKLEWNTDDCPPTGIAAFVLLLWMNLSTLAPFRCWSYEFFVVQHLITFFGFIIAVMYHLPSTALGTRVYIYVPIGLWFVDRAIRTNLFIWFNTPSSLRGGAPKATLTALDGGVTKVQLSNSKIQHWSPGSFVLLSIPRFGWIESHPATIMSSPRSENGDMVFLLKSQQGFTKRIMTSANNSTTALLPSTKQESEEQQNQQIQTHTAFVNGPYGGSHSDFGAFDSICLIAGSTGVTFTLAILQDLADRAVVFNKKLPLQRVHFIWCVKDVSWMKWCNTAVSTAVSKLRSVGTEVDVSIYVTCADAFTEQNGASKECGCQCDKSLGPCCCVVVDDLEEDKDDSKNELKDEKGSVIGKSAEATSVQLGILPCAAFYSGRPQIREIIEDMLDGADGESGIAVCGPIGMSSSVRNTVVRLSDERAIHKGSGAQGCYLHVESFS
jgi:predicted ferric reductase